MDIKSVDFKGLQPRIWVSGPIGDSLLKKIQRDVQALRVPLPSPKPRVCVSSRSARKGKCIIEGSRCRASGAMQGLGVVIE